MISSVIPARSSDCPLPSTTKDQQRNRLLCPQKLINQWRTASVPADTQIICGSWLIARMAARFLGTDKPLPHHGVYLHGNGFVAPAKQLLDHPTGDGLHDAQCPPFRRGCHAIHVCLPLADSPCVAEDAAFLFFAFAKQAWRIRDRNYFACSRQGRWWQSLLSSVDP